jgi:hypothetical protein
MPSCAGASTTSSCALRSHRSAVCRTRGTIDITGVISTIGHKPIDADDHSESAIVQICGAVDRDLGSCISSSPGANNTCFEALLHLVSCPGCAPALRDALWRKTTRGPPLRAGLYCLRPRRRVRVRPAKELFTDRPPRVRAGLVSLSLCSKTRGVLCKQSSVCSSTIAT